MVNDKEFQFLLEKISRNRDIDFSHYRDTVLKRKIQSRMHATDCKDYWEYLMLLNTNPLEYDSLIQAMTIKVSEFFRNPDVFVLMREIIVPEIIAQKQQSEDKNIRAWSCGAAWGQEAYSMAILFCETLGKRLRNVDLQITATDIDPEVVETAPWGAYEKLSLNRVPPHLLYKYFIRLKDRYVLKDRIRNLVSFKYHDVLSGRLNYNHLNPNHLNQGMDLVLCRNLLIYFRKAHQVKALSNIYNSMNPGGFLLLGKTETLPAQIMERFEAIDLRDRIYRKK
ncbi:MAG: protein-glutamate O-methyltransferase CheR [Desulfobacteraceae bacterium]|nr:protein-glutamate O-methyltransferase CheR [Desulfobacteraceae bacterium]